MPHAVDVHVGMRLRQRRWALGISQHQLAAQTGVKFQQIQKYESGQNRISASRLYDVAPVLRVRVSYFFEGLAGGKPEQALVQGDTLADREARALIQAYYAIPETQRRRLFDLARVIGRANGDESDTTDGPSGQVDRMQ